MKSCADGNGEETGDRQYIHNFMRLPAPGTLHKGTGCVKKKGKNRCGRDNGEEHGIAPPPAGTSKELVPRMKTSRRIRLAHRRRYGAME
jgi:hypothetical protein